MTQQNAASPACNTWRLALLRVPIPPGYPQR